MLVLSIGFIFYNSQLTCVCSFPCAALYTCSLTCGCSYEKIAIFEDIKCPLTGLSWKTQIFRPEDLRPGCFSIRLYYLSLCVNILCLILSLYFSFCLLFLDFNPPFTFIFLSLTIGPIEEKLSNL